MWKELLTDGVLWLLCLFLCKCSNVVLMTTQCDTDLVTAIYICFGDSSSTLLNEFQFQGKCSPTCSRCSSQCSSLAGSSPKLDKFAYPPPQPAFSVPPSSDHSLMSEGSEDHALPSRKISRFKRHERKNSLPEMIAHPHDSIPKIRSVAAAKLIGSILKGMFVSL